MKNPSRGGLSLHEDPFFRDLDPAVVNRIEGLVYQRAYEARQIVYFPDDRCDHVYWVRTGRFRITRVSGDGRELSFRHVVPGGFFGEECLVGRPRREDYAEAMAPGELLLMRCDDFRRCVAEEHAFCAQVAHAVCQRAIEVETVLANTVFHSVRGRVAAGLLRLYHQEDGGGALNVTHQELANLIGSTRETTTATLHQLRREGIVELANRRLTVIDPVALENASRSS